jgi:hypothetical protein
MYHSFQTGHFPLMQFCKPLAKSGHILGNKHVSLRQSHHLNPMFQCFSVSSVSPYVLFINFLMLVFMFFFSTIGMIETRKCFMKHQIGQKTCGFAPQRQSVNAEVKHGNAICF